MVNQAITPLSVPQHQKFYSVTNASNASYIVDVKDQKRCNGGEKMSHEGNDAVIDRKRDELEVNYCDCGSYDEWQPSDTNGTEVEPDIHWSGHYKCMNCGNVELLVKLLLSVTGSHGELMVNSITGEILKRSIGKCDCDECESYLSYPEIDKFDVTDLTVPIYWDKHGIGYIDIVRIGYWINNGEYEPPVIITNEGERE